MTEAGISVRSRSDLLPRAASAAVLGALALGTAWVGGWSFDLFWFLAGLLVLSEWQGLTRLRRRNALSIAGSVPLGLAVAGLGRDNITFALIPLAIGALLTFGIAQPRERGFAASGLVYAAVLAVAVPLLRHSKPDGFAIVIWLFAVVWGTDTMAYFGGRTIGGPKLAPRLSPSKTWSGFLVGVGSGALLGLLVAPRPTAVLPVLLAGLAAGATSQGGDLFESALKRRFGVKDAGSLIPGHGGVMDRLDGFIAATALAAVVGLWRFGPDGAGAGLLRW